MQPLRAELTKIWQSGPCWNRSIFGQALSSSPSSHRPLKIKMKFLTYFFQLVKPNPTSFSPAAWAHCRPSPPRSGDNCWASWPARCSSRSGRLTWARKAQDRRVRSPRRDRSHPCPRTRAPSSWPSSRRSPAWCRTPQAGSTQARRRRTAQLPGDVLGCCKSSTTSNDQINFFCFFPQVFFRV